MKALALLFMCINVYAQDVWVDGYYRSDGTYVDGYYRTAPDNTTENNYSTIGNQNPYNGKWGTQSGDNYSYTTSYNYKQVGNSLSEVMPAPIADVSDIVKQYANGVELPSTNYTYEDPLQALEDNRLKFYDYDKPATMTTTSAYKEPEPIKKYDSTGSIGLSIVFVFLGLVSLLFIKRH